MKNILAFVLTIMSFYGFAEIYEDYAPSEEHVQLTVVAVEPNYLDDYLVNLNRTWVKGMEIQKKLGYIEDTLFIRLIVLTVQMLWSTKHLDC